MEYGWIAKWVREYVNRGYVVCLGGYCSVMVLPNSISLVH